MCICVYACVNIGLCACCLHVSVCVELKARAVSWAKEPSERPCSVVLRGGMEATVEWPPTSSLSHPGLGKLEF